MGFLDKAKAAANDLAAKADGALSQAGLGGPGGSSDALFRDLGKAVFAQSKGQGDPGAVERLIGELTRLEQSGQGTGGQPYGAPPPPPGQNAGQNVGQASAPPAPPHAPPIGPGGFGGPGDTGGFDGQSQPGQSAPEPPEPSWQSTPPPPPPPPPSA